VCHVLDGDAANGPRTYGAEVTAHDDALEVASVAVENHHHLSVRRVALLKPVVHAEANSLVVVRDRARREDQRPLGNVDPEPGRRDQRPFSVLPQGEFYPVNSSAHGQHAPHVVIGQHSRAHGDLPAPEWLRKSARTMISRHPAPFPAFVSRYTTIVVDGMVSWFPPHTGGQEHGRETHTSARTRRPERRHTLGMGVRA
jgi:hypothetical protein